MRSIFGLLSLAVTASALSSVCIKQWCPLHEGSGLTLLTPDLTETVPVYIALPYLNTDKLDRIFDEVTDPRSEKYGQYLTHEQMYDLIGNPNATAAVLAWLHAEGIEARVSKSQYGISAIGPVAAVERAFGAEYQVFEHRNRVDPRSGKALRIFRSAKHAVPPSMAAHIGYVAHVSDFYENKIRPQIASEASLNATGANVNYNYGNIRPQSVWSQYNTPCTPECNSKTGTEWQTAGGNLHGLYEDGSYAAQSDLTTFFKNFVCKGSGAGSDACAAGTTATQPNIDVKIGTNQDVYCQYEPSLCGEATLDFQYMSAVAPGMATIDGYWFTGESLSGFATTFSDLVEQLQVAGSPKVVSISYGLDEGELPSATLTSTNTAFQSIGAQGHSIFVASGDAGASNYRGGAVQSGSANCGYNPSWPTASPYVTSVGATSLSPSQGTSSITNDVVYYGTGKTSFEGGTDGGAEIPSSGGNPYGNQVTTGGGFSCLFGAESYQTDAITAYQSGDDSSWFTAGASGKAGDSKTCAYSGTTSTAFNKQGRGFPDLVALGWQYELIINGQNFPGVAGTSAASPVVAAMFSIINGQRLAAGKAPVGFVNTALYQAPDNVFTKVQPGTNDKTDNACTTSGNGCCDMGFVSKSGKWNAFRGLGAPIFDQLQSHFTDLP